LKGLGWIDVGRSAATNGRGSDVGVSAIAAGQAPANKTSGFAASRLGCRRHEESILIAVAGVAGW
jgi:hypothetical protein